VGFEGVYTYILIIYMYMYEEERNNINNNQEGLRLEMAFPQHGFMFQQLHEDNAHHLPSPTSLPSCPPHLFYGKYLSPSYQNLITNLSIFRLMFGHFGIHCVITLKSQVTKRSNNW